MIQEIQLPNGTWKFDSSRQLGDKGGFGTVFEGYSDQLGELAVKRLHLDAQAAAHREMEIAEELLGKSYKNVIPIYDAGLDDKSGGYFVVMARAEKSLQSELSKSLSANDVVKILLDIANGLLEVPGITHRDLKPANVLFHSGSWKIADFGIARFVEESTSLHTLKGCLSPPYAAPEQWEFVKATSKTDIYALGCIGHALLTGRPPFIGPNFHEQHLYSDPPPLPESITPKLRTIISMMLRKHSDSRPDIKRINELLRQIVDAPSEDLGRGGFDVLAKAGAQVSILESQEERILEQERRKAESRDSIAKAGLQNLDDIVQRLFRLISIAAPNAQRNDSKVTLGFAELTVSFRVGGIKSTVKALPSKFMPMSGWDVLIGEEIWVNQFKPVYPWRSTLWYCKLPSSNDYRWYEVSYFAPMHSEVVAPYSLLESPNHADLAASNVMHVYELAFGPDPIDDENESQFCERWAAILGLASAGKLGIPRSLPLWPKLKLAGDERTH